jgi:hypothetical protein
MTGWPDLEQANPQQYRRNSRIATLAFVHLEFGILAAMAYYDVSVRWMIAVAFLLGALLVTGTLREATYWLAVRR